MERVTAAFIGLCCLGIWIKVAWDRYGDEVRAWWQAFVVAYHTRVSEQARLAQMWGEDA